MIISILLQLLARMHPFACPASAWGKFIHGV